jgi:hypothetical protein
MSELAVSEDIDVATAAAVATVSVAAPYGRMSKWVESMRQLKERRGAERRQWVDEMSSLLEACHGWLEQARAWAREIGVLVLENREINLYVIPISLDERTVETLRDVAQFEIVLGAVFQIDVRAHLTIGYSSDCHTVIKHANTQSAC